MFEEKAELSETEKQQLKIYKDNHLKCMVDIEGYKQHINHIMERFIKIIDLDETAPRPFLINNLLNLKPQDFKSKLQFNNMHVCIGISQISFKKERKNIAIYPKLQAN